MKHLCLTLITAAALIGGISAAQAYGGTHLTIHSEIGGAHYCMDASLDHGVKDGDPVYVYKCHGRDNQRWTVTQSVGGEAALIGTDGFCLDVRGFAKGPGTPVQLYQCHFKDNQRFKATPDGHIQEIASGKCLSAMAASDRAPVVLEACKDVPNQTWKFEH